MNINFIQIIAYEFENVTQQIETGNVIGNVCLRL